jgi:hypothetical protein
MPAKRPSRRAGGGAFHGPRPPENPRNGWLWLNSANGHLYAYDEGVWVDTSIGAAFTIAPQPLKNIRIKDWLVRFPREERGNSAWAHHVVGEAANLGHGLNFDSVLSGIKRSRS